LCENKATGHKDDATADNIQGGNDRMVNRSSRKPKE
jgi:hypothetical protein